jgi:hypothetical protein
MAGNDQHPRQHPVRPRPAWLSTARRVQGVQTPGAARPGQADAHLPQAQLASRRRFARAQDALLQMSEPRGYLRAGLRVTRAQLLHSVDCRFPDSS